MTACSHGTADNFLLDTEGNKTWNIESLVTEVGMDGVLLLLPLSSSSSSFPPGL